MIENAKRAGRASGAALLTTLLLVNAAAIWGQAGWALSHISEKIIPQEWAHAAGFGIALAIGFAMAIEGVGVFLALSADEADEAGLPAGGVRLASYAWGFFVSGGLNLSHWSFGAAGIAFAALSAISPLLWGVRARIRRGRSIAPSRRFWHPIRSIALIRAMAWEGIATEEEGIAHLNSQTPAPVEPIVAEAEIEPETVEPAPQIELPAPRIPRKSGQQGAGNVAARELLAGATTAEASERSGLSIQNVRKYAKAIQALRVDPNAPIALSSGVVAMLRDEIRRSAV